MKTYTIEGKEYNFEKDLIEKYPLIFKGYANGRVFILTNNIPKSKYIFAKLINNEWILSSGISKRLDKLFFIKGWFEEKYVNNESSEESEEGEENEEIEEVEDNET